MKWVPINQQEINRLCDMLRDRAMERRRKAENIGVPSERRALESAAARDYLLRKKLLEAG